MRRQIKPAFEIGSIFTIQGSNPLHLKEASRSQ